MSDPDAPDTLPPGPPGLPLLGNTLRFFRVNPLEWFPELTDSYGDVVRLSIAGQSVILLSDPAAIEHVLVTNNQNYRKGGFQKMVTDSLLGDGLVLSEGETWRSHRRGLEPAFHPDRMRDYARIVQSQTRRHLDSWSAGDVLDLEREMKQLTVRIIVDALFGIDLASEASDLEAAFTRILKHFERISQTYVYLPEWIPTPENRAYRRALATLNDTVHEIIQMHRRGEVRRQTVVTRLLDGEWSEKEMRDEIVTLLVAGHETTALTLTFTGYLLGRHPHVARRVETEVRALDELSIEGLGDCTLLDRVVKESLRLYPPVYGIFREPISDDELDGYRIPAGSILALNQWVVHRDGRIFADPEAFRPERWTEAFERDLSSGAYFPFAAGPRRCIGDRLAMIEVRMILGMVLREYRLSLASDPVIDVVPSLTTQPKCDINLRIEER